MKYIIEIEEQPLDGMDGCTQIHPTLYRAKGFNTLVFDEEGLKRLKPCEEEQEEKKSRIKVGDEVVHRDGTKAVVLDEGLLENCWKVITENRTVEPWHKTLLKKTGRHFDEIEYLLKKLRGEE